MRVTVKYELVLLPASDVTPNFAPLLRTIEKWAGLQTDLVRKYGPSLGYTCRGWTIATGEGGEDAKLAISE